MTGNVELTQEDNLLIQSYATTAFLSELHNNKYLESECFQNLAFEDVAIKSILLKTGLGNQGSLLMALYAMLVIPKQLLEVKFPEEFIELNSKVHSIKSGFESNYKYDKKGLCYITHIRNSVAHARVVFIPQVSVTFFDVRGDNDKRGKQKCSITIPLLKMGELLTALQSIYMKFVTTLHVKVP